MKIILSRKGFDSGSGGFPSPILPDGSLLSLPIPDKNSPIAYQDISWNGYNVGEVVESLTGGKIPAHYRAHLDPDLIRAALPRHSQWQPLFGQVGAAQGHLRNQEVGPGDLFLFFGLFQAAIVDHGRLRLNPKSSPRHIIWGWFQLEATLAVDQINRTQLEWAVYHPHFHRPPDPSNTVYLAKRRLDIPGLDGKNLGGAGIFPHFSGKRLLTASASRPSLWKLPQWMFPADEESALSYHRNASRWEKYPGYALLQTVGRGQEFVLDCFSYPDSMPWVSNLFVD